MTVFDGPVRGSVAPSSSQVVGEESTQKSTSDHVINRINQAIKTLNSPLATALHRIIVFYA